MNWKSYSTLGVSVKNRNDEADYDYIHKLSKEQLLWLKAFNREYTNADFKHPFIKLIKGKRARKFIYDRNNARNRDLYSILKWTHRLYLSEKIKENKNKESVQLFERYGT